MAAIESNSGIEVREDERLREREREREEPGRSYRMHCLFVVRGE